MSTLSGLPTPLPIGTAEAANDSYNAKLGKIYEVNGKMYILVKAASAITAAAGKAQTLQFTLGVPSGTVDFPVAGAPDFLVAIPAGQTGSSGSTSIAASDVFLAKIFGAHTAMIAAGTASILASQFGLFANTAGQWVSSTAVYLGGRSRFTNTTAATAAGAAVTGFINGIV